MFIAGVGVAVLACRDVTLSGARIGDSHVLAGRPAERGGPQATEAEVAAGVFVTVDEDLSATQTALRRMLKIGADVELDTDGLPGTVSFYAADSVRVPNRFDFTQPVTTPESHSLTTPFATFNTQTLVDELEAACKHPILKTALQSTCSALDIDTGNLLIDGLTFHTDNDNIHIGWLPPGGDFNVRATTRSSDDDSAGTECDAARPCDLGFRCTGEVPPASDGGVGTPGSCTWESVECRSDADCIDETRFGLFGASCSGAGRRSTPRGAPPPRPGGRVVRHCGTRVWVSSEHDASPDHAVLGIDLPWTVTATDPDDGASSASFVLSVNSFTTRLRLQAVPCSDSGCTNATVSYTDYRGPGSDLRNDGVGLTFSAVGQHLGDDVSTMPGLACIHACPDSAGSGVISIG